MAEASCRTRKPPQHVLQPHLDTTTLTDVTVATAGWRRQLFVSWLDDPVIVMLILKVKSCAAVFRTTTSGRSMSSRQRLWNSAFKSLSFESGNASEAYTQIDNSNEIVMVEAIAESGGLVAPASAGPSIVLMPASTWTKVDFGICNKRASLA